MPGRGSPSYDVAGKVALVTGAAEGIGLALTRLLHERGATVAMLDVSPDRLEAAAASLGGGGRLLTVRADVRDREAMAAAVGEVVERHGGLDVAVANAGVAPRAVTLRTIDPDEFDRVIAVNQTGVFNTVRPAIEPIIERRGHFVVVSSVAAFAPGPGAAPYMVSKAGVEQLGRALRIELAPHGASAGVAYFGIVGTAMVHTRLDDDPVLSRVHRLMPLPLRQRITPERAGTVIADGIARRAPRTIAPAGWRPWALGRGFLNIGIDRLIASRPETHALIRDLEQRAEGNA